MVCLQMLKNLVTIIATLPGPQDAQRRVVIIVTIKNLEFHGHLPEGHDPVNRGQWTKSNRAINFQYKANQKNSLVSGTP